MPPCRARPDDWHHAFTWRVDEAYCSAADRLFAEENCRNRRTAPTPRWHEQPLRHDRATRLFRLHRRLAHWSVDTGVLARGDLLTAMGGEKRAAATRRRRCNASGARSRVASGRHRRPLVAARPRGSRHAARRAPVDGISRRRFIDVMSCAEMLRVSIDRVSRPVSIPASRRPAGAPLSDACLRRSSFDKPASRRAARRPRDLRPTSTAADAGGRGELGADAEGGRAVDRPATAAPSRPLVPRARRRPFRERPVVI